MSLGSQGSFFLGSSGAAAGGGGGYKIQRSLRFNDDDSSYLNKTFSSSGNRRTFTFSFWAKLGDIAAQKNIITASSNPGASSSSSPRTEFRFTGDGGILFATNITGSSWNSLSTTAVFRDPSAWYHVVVAVDTTQATESNRVKIYVNGVQEFWSGSVAGQNDETPYNNTYGHAIGTYANNYNDFFDGYLAEFISIDGQALAPTDFGEFDSNSVWQPKEFDGTYGTNGFKLDFSDTSSDSALGTDSSGNGNDWTVNNLTAYTDNYTSRVYTENSASYNSSATGTTFYTGVGANLFDGNTSTLVGGYNLAKSWLYFRPDVAITGVTSLEIHGSYNENLKINGTDYSATFGTSAAWVTVSNPPSSISEIAFQGMEAHGAAPRASAIKINGVVLTTPIPSSVDALRDSPSQIADQTDTGVGGEVIGNYATWNPLFGENQSLSNGNLKAASSTTAYSIIASTLAMKSGKWYMEYTYTPNNGQPYITWGISQTNRDGSQGSGVTDTPEDKGFKAWDSGFYSQSDGSNIYDYSSSVSSGDIISLAFDADAGKLWVAKNGTYMTNASGAGNPTAGTNPDYSGLDYSGGYYFMAGPYYTNGSTLEANFGQRSWAFAAPTNFKALCTANLSEPTIPDGSTAFDTKLFTGNASTQSITGLNFSPSLVWTKSRSLSYSHRLYDTVRGTNNWLASNLTDEATAESETLTSFDANGFTLGQYDNGNYSNGDTAVAWAWDTASSNTTIAVGDLNTSVYYMSEVWSEDLYTADTPADAPTVTTKSFLSGYPATLPFNGDTNRGSNETYAADSLKTIVFRPDTALTDVTKLEIYTNGTYTTDAGYNSATSVITGNTATGWQTLYEGTAITLNYVWAYKNNGQGAFSGLKINGRMLTDSDATPPISYPSIASTVRANPSAGFSIVSYTGTGSAGTIAHNLNKKPDFVITKNLTTANYWAVWNSGLTANNFLRLDLDMAEAAEGNYWTDFDSNVVHVPGSGSTLNNVNNTSKEYISYLWTSVEGYSAFGSYTGNGSTTDGPFVYTGFNPKFIIVKRIDSAANWWMFDLERGTNELLYPNLANAEGDQGVSVFDLNSNGFKLRVADSEVNASNATYIYTTFAEHPFKTARAR